MATWCSLFIFKMFVWTTRCEVRIPPGSGLEEVLGEIGRVEKQVRRKFHRMHPRRWRALRALFHIKGTIHARLGCALPLPSNGLLVITEVTPGWDTFGAEAIAPEHRITVLSCQLRETQTDEEECLHVTQHADAVIEEGVKALNDSVWLRRRGSLHDWLTEVLPPRLWFGTLELKWIGWILQVGRREERYAVLHGARHVKEVMEYNAQIGELLWHAALELGGIQRQWGVEFSWYDVDDDN